MYNVVTDLHEGFYIFVQLANKFLELVWLGKIVENPKFDLHTKYFRKVLIQWYTPCGTSKDIHLLYFSWDMKMNFKLKVDKKALTHDYVLIDSIMASWKPHKNDGNSWRSP